MKLNLGSGAVLKKGFINVDIMPEDLVKGPGKYVKADLTKKLPFEDESADLVELFSVLEHMAFRDVAPVLKEIYRVMKKGAKLIIVTDDFDGLAVDWFRMRRGPFDLDRYIDVAETVYGNQNHEGEFHKCAMTPEFLNWALVSVGFDKGDLRVLPKGMLVPKIGSNPAKPKAVLRNDQLVAEVTK